MYRAGRMGRASRSPRGTVWPTLFMGCAVPARRLVPCLSYYPGMVGRPSTARTVSSRARHGMSPARPTWPTCGEAEGRWRLAREGGPKPEELRKLASGGGREGGEERRRADHGAAPATGAEGGLEEKAMRRGRGGLGAHGEEEGRAMLVTRRRRVGRRGCGGLGAHGEEEGRATPATRRRRRRAGLRRALLLGGACGGGGGRGRGGRQLGEEAKLGSGASGSGRAACCRTRRALCHCRTCSHAGGGKGRGAGQVGMRPGSGLCVAQHGSGKSDH